MKHFFKNVIGYVYRAIVVIGGINFVLIVITSLLVVGSFFRTTQAGDSSLENLSRWYIGLIMNHGLIALILGVTTLIFFWFLKKLEK